MLNDGYDIPAFICEVGAARSGTNLLGRVLSHHPMLAYWTRPKYIWRHGNAWKKDDVFTAEHARPRVIRYIRRRFWEYWKQSGKPRLMVTTQAMILSLDFVNAIYPDGKVLHIIRDGREVAASQRKEWEIHINPTGGGKLLDRLPEVPMTDLPAYFGEFVESYWRRFTKSKYRAGVGPKIENWRQLGFSMDKLEFSALNWKTCVQTARAIGRTMPRDRYFEVRYEDLLNEPQETIPVVPGTESLCLRDNRTSVILRAG